MRGNAVVTLELQIRRKTERARTSIAHLRWLLPTPDVCQMLLMYPLKRLASAGMKKSIRRLSLCPPFCFLVYELNFKIKRKSKHKLFTNTIANSSTI